jgi:hypothetical protein
MQAADYFNAIPRLCPFERLSRAGLDRRAFQAVDPSAGTGRASHGYPEDRQHVPAGQVTKRRNLGQAPAQLDPVLVFRQFVTCVHAAMVQTGADPQRTRATPCGHTPALWTTDPVHVACSC